MFMFSPDTPSTAAPWGFHAERESVQDTSDKKEEGSDERERFKEVAQHLSSEQNLENTEGHQAVLAQDRDNFCEQGFLKVDFGKHKDDALDDIEDETEACPKVTRRLIWNARFL